MIIDTDDYLSIPAAAKIIGTGKENMNGYVAKGRIKVDLEFWGRKYLHKETVKAWKKEYAKICRPKKRYRLENDAQN